MLNSVIRSLKAACSFNRSIFSAYGIFGSRNNDERATPSTKPTKAITFASIISAVSSALSFRWTSIFSKTALRPMSVPIIPCDTTTTSTKQPKINNNFFRMEKIFLVCCVPAAVFLCCWLILKLLPFICEFYTISVQRKNAVCKLLHCIMSGISNHQSD